MNIKRILRESIVSIIIISIFGISYAALSSLTSTEGETLTAAKWNDLVEHSVPSKSVMAFYDTVCPTGWSKANGTNGNPDLRGEFIRGLDDGRGIDSGRVLGAYQGDTMQGHKHYWTDKNGNDSSAAADAPAPSFYSGEGVSFNRPGVFNTADHWVLVGGPKNDGTNGTPRISSETRPRNIALLYCIKD